MRDLKPCPFCGYMPQCGVDFYESHAAEVKLAAVVECTGCGIAKSVIFNASHPISHIPFRDFDDAFDDVVNAWNMRVGDAERKTDGDTD